MADGPEDFVIEKEGKSGAGFLSPRHFTSSARAALRHILEVKRRSGARCGILLPAYIGLSPVEGSGVFDPVCEAEVPYAFYQVDDRLRPDLQDIEQQLRTGRFGLVLLIHYFGCAQVAPAAVVAVCRRYGVQVIEDCAHTLLGGLGPEKLGTFGDYAIFSVHKTAPTSDGGFFYDHVGDVAGHPLAPGAELCRSTLEQFARFHAEAASARRRHLYLTVASWVAELPALELFFATLPPGTVPLNCPVLVPPPKRKALYFALAARGVKPTALYHRLIPALSGGRYASAHRVSTSILNLPTHSDVSDAHLARYRLALHDAVREVFGS